MKKENLILLDCTIRDGNYAIGFKFTKNDTALLTQKLAGLGFKWIEIGHGLGLGAMSKGKGDMPNSDGELIDVAVRHKGNSKIGVFFIPGIGSFDDIEKAAEKNLDFIRIGYNADDIEKSFPYIEKAKQFGLTVCLNFMKSYVISPETFAKKSKLAYEIGVDVVYLVDSAGCMLPEEIKSYFSEVKNICDVELGFHGHNNLMQVIVNCIEAYRIGVHYLDVSMCGLGRSAGNAASEVLIAYFKRMGIDVGIDLFDLMNLIETYMWPLVKNTRTHDMMGITAGFSRFHSSFLPRVKMESKKYNADLKRLVYEVATKDPAELDEDHLKISAKKLKNTHNEKVSNALTSFMKDGFDIENICNTFDSFQNLTQRLNVLHHKMSGMNVVIKLEFSKEFENDQILSEYVLTTKDMVLGKVIFGSVDSLKRILDMAQGLVFLYLIDFNEYNGIRAKNKFFELLKDRNVYYMDEGVLNNNYLKEIVDSYALKYGYKDFLIYGYNTYMESLLKNDVFEKIYLYTNKNQNLKYDDKVIVINSFDDWKYLDVQFDLIYCASKMNDDDLKILLRHLKSNGSILHCDAFIEYPDERIIKVDFNKSYDGILGRFLSTIKK